MRETEDTPTVVVSREFLDAPESGSGAHVIVTRDPDGWCGLRVSDGQSTIHLDFPVSIEGLVKLDRLSKSLLELREAIAFRCRTTPVR